MAAYDYRCHPCDTVFEVRRGISDDASDVRCPDGHREVSRVWSAVAVGGRAAGAPGASATPAAGGCCGGGCCG
ncbi:MAG: zinc ribbon domain-containing protein [Actinomycetota bacterium]|nr:zinc ribbon domain-containing protein [Actinomycetota bacterium]